LYRIREADKFHTQPIWIMSFHRLRLAIQPGDLSTAEDCCHRPVRQFELHINQCTGRNFDLSFDKHTATEDIQAFPDITFATKGEVQAEKTWLAVFPNSIQKRPSRLQKRMPAEWFNKLGITTAPLSQFRLFFGILVTDHDD
jgi:hypothetical protein